jgi:HlyD family secretion protein
MASALAPAPARRGRFGRVARNAVAAAAVTLGAAWAASHWLTAPSAASTEITAHVTRAPLPITVTERGEMESSKTVDARCEVEGYQNKIVEILPEGTRVTKDQVVVRFDAADITRKVSEHQVKVKQAEGKAKATYEELDIAKNKGESEVAKADLTLKLADLDRVKYIEGEYLVEVEDKKGAIALAHKELEESKDRLVNYRKFVKKGFGTPEQLAWREQEVARAEYNLKRDEAKLEVLEKFTRQRQEVELRAKAEEAVRDLQRTKRSSNATVAKADTDHEAAEETARLEKNELERLQKQLDGCVVRAPQDGILVYSKDRYYDPSARIQAGAMVHFQQTLFSLPDLARMQVKVKIHESMVKKVKPEQKAEIRIDAFPNLVLEGTVDTVSMLADSRGYWDEGGVKEYVTIVKIDDVPDVGIKPGMTAEVKVKVTEVADALIVPVEAVTEREGKHYAYVLDDRGKAERRTLSVGDNNDKFIQVQQGLSEGEPVALNARARMASETKASEKNGGAAPPVPAAPTQQPPAVARAKPQ